MSGFALWVWDMGYVYIDYDVTNCHDFSCWLGLLFLLLFLVDEFFFSLLKLRCHKRK